MDKIRIRDLYGELPEYLTPLFCEREYPWELLAHIKEYISALLPGNMLGYKRYSDGVLIGEGVKIYPGVVIEPPAIIGDGSVLRPGAFVRGSVIVGKGCVIGNSTELKNCILLDGVQAPHYNYVGDSVLGKRVHLGAGAVCSNLKSDGRCVVVHGYEDHDTGLRKVGAFLGDGADVGCGCVLNPGTVIGKGSVVYPNSTLRGVFGEGKIIKSQTLVVNMD